MESTSLQTAATERPKHSQRCRQAPTCRSQVRPVSDQPSPQLASPAFSLGPMLGATVYGNHPRYQFTSRQGLPQASAPVAQGNPWQEAFQALSASLNTSNPYQTQAPSSAYLTTPTSQAGQSSQLGVQLSRNSKPSIRKPRPPVPKLQPGLTRRRKWTTGWTTRTTWQPAKPKTGT